MATGEAAPSNQGIRKEVARQGSDLWATDVKSIPKDSAVIQLINQRF